MGINCQFIPPLEFMSRGHKLGAMMLEPNRLLLGVHKEYHNIYLKYMISTMVKVTLLHGGF